MIHKGGACMHGYSFTVLDIETVARIETNSIPDNKLTLSIQLNDVAISFGVLDAMEPIHHRYSSIKVTAIDTIILCPKHCSLPKDRVIVQSHVFFG